MDQDTLGRDSQVEACHEEDHVAKKKPVLAKSDFAFSQKGTCDVALGVSEGLAVPIGLCLRQAETEDDDQNGWAGAEPK